MHRIIALLLALLACALAAEEKKIVCYYGSWAIYRPENGKFEPTTIDPTLCTHLIYTFIGITEQGDINILDKWADLPDGGGLDGYGKFNQLRSKNPKVKTLIAVGGWNEGSVKYSKMVSKPETRANFAKNAVAFVKKYGFDGLDFDWEYPSQRGGVAADKENFVLLLKELRQLFDENGLILSAALGAAQKSASLSYNIPEVVKYLDFANVMAYDFHVAADNKTGINAPFYAASSEKDEDRLLNVDAAIKYWLSQGAPAEKIILGVPFYGRTFTLADPKNTGIGAPSKGPGTAGPYTREPGTWGYNEICELQRNDTNWVVKFQEEQRVPYAYLKDQWVGYDNPQSLTEKAEYVNKLGLGGVVIWSIETDDFRGSCGPKNPLLKTLNHVLRNGPPLNPPAEPSVL